MKKFYNEYFKNLHKTYKTYDVIDTKNANVDWTLSNKKETKIFENRIFWNVFVYEKLNWNNLYILSHRWNLLSQCVFKMSFQRMYLWKICNSL